MSSREIYVSIALGEQNHLVGRLSRKYQPVSQIICATKCGGISYTVPDRSLTNQLRRPHAHPRLSAWSSTVAIRITVVRSLWHDRRTPSRTSVGRDEARIKVTLLFSIVCLLSQPLRDKKDRRTGGTSGTRDKSVSGVGFSLQKPDFGQESGRTSGRRSRGPRPVGRKGGAFHTALRQGLEAIRAFPRKRVNRRSRLLHHAE